MGTVSGRGSAHFVKPQRARVVARWTGNELQVIQSAVSLGLTLDETWDLLPHRSRDSVKDRYYRARAPQDRDEPGAISDARRQKDAREGSAKLLEAMQRAGFVLMPRKVG